jgi:hypothetical protein
MQIYMSFINVQFLIFIYNFEIIYGNVLISFVQFIETILVFIFIVNFTKINCLILIFAIIICECFINIIDQKSHA